MMKKITKELIELSVKKARKKHPQFCLDTAEMVCLLVEEVGELAQCINDGDYNGARDEALDSIAVLIRFLEGD